MNLSELVERHADRIPDHPAIEDRGRTISYAELSRLVRAAAAWLRAQGARPGGRVGVALKDTSDFVILSLAVVRAGCTLLPVDWKARPGEKARLVDAFCPDFVVSEPGGAMPASVPRLERPDDWAADASPEVFSRPPVAVTDQPFSLQLSSGSTGQPKAMPVTHHQYLSRLRVHCAEVGMRPDDRIMSVLPLCFGMGRQSVYATLTFGATLVLHPPLFTPGSLLEAIEEKAVTGIMLVPATVRSLLEATDGQAHALPGMRCLMVGGAPLSGAEKRQVAEQLTPNLFDLYGTAGIGTATYLKPADLATHADTVGRAAADVEIEIVDDRDVPVAAGKAGRLRCRGPGMATGVIGDPLDDEGLRSGWCYTGEIARMDGDGFVTLLGRRAGLILKNGISIYPEEIERVLRSHEAVVECCVVGVGDGTREDRIWAFVTSRSRGATGDLETMCRRELSAFKSPDRIVALDSMPRLTSGKPDRQALLERIRSGGFATY